MSGKQLEEDLHRSRMELQLSQWEKAQYLEQISKLKAALRETSASTGTGSGVSESPERVKVDPEIGFRYRGQALASAEEMTSGYTPRVPPPSEVSTLRSCHSEERGEVSLIDWTPRGAGEEVSTPAVFAVHEEHTSRNPVMEEANAPGAKKLHSGLMSFATRPPSTKAEGVAAGDPAIDIAGPCQLRRNARFIEEDTLRRRRESTPSRPSIVPDRFNGKVPWNEYYGHFESCRRVNQWNDVQAAEFLAASLQGDAVRILGDKANRGYKLTYTELVKALAARFGPGQQAENFLVELRHRRQKHKETLQELAQVIHELAVRAYPEIPDESRDRLEKMHFIDAVSDQAVREGIFRARPKNLSEAVQAALETDNFQQAEAHRKLERPAKFARAADPETEGQRRSLEAVLSKQTQNLSELSKQLEAALRLLEGRQPSNQVTHAVVPNDSGSALPPKRRTKGDMKCHNCGIKGHFARECTKPKRKWFPATGNDRQPTKGPADGLDSVKGPQEQA